MRLDASNFESRWILSAGRQLVKTYPSIPSQTIDIPNERLDPRRDWTSPGRAPESPDADLTGEEPTTAKRSCFLMTDGRDSGGISRGRSGVMVAGR